MHLTDHLTDVQLNEYLDNEGKDRVQAESHLSSCVDCAARLAALQALFDEIESLPEVALSRDLAAPVVRRVSGRAALPRFLHLTVALQFAAAMVALVFTAPFVAQFLSPYLSDLQAPSLVDLFLQVQSQWTVWLDMLSQLQLPNIPEIPVFELPSLVIMLTVVGVSVLWLLGNGLLLRNQIK
jgi:anti-sigma factor RsiW